LKITYEIKTLEDFKEIPMISKIGVCIFCLSAITCILFGFFRVFGIGEKFYKDEYFFYCIVAGFIGFFTAILFDKDRKKRTKIGIKGPN
jgi:uncharacterized membrane protein